MEENQQSNIFLDKQILITTILAGPLASGYMLSRNFKNTGQKKASRISKGAGILAMLLIMLLNIFIVETFLFPAGAFEGSSAKGYSLIILLFILFQSLVGALYWIYRKKVNGRVIAEVSKNRDRIYSTIHLVPYFLLGFSITGYLLIADIFWFTFTVIYLLPNLYLYNHIKKIFATQRQKLIFTFLFILVVILFPIGEALEHNTDNGLAHVSLWVGYYYLPLLLYTFLFYLLFDLVRLINWIIKIFPGHILKTKKSRTIALTVILIITSGIVGKGIHNFNHTKINSYNIEIPKRESGLDKLKIALAADFHFSDRTSKTFVNQFVQKINSVEPDLVLLAGDLIESMPGKTKTAFIREELKKLNAKYGVYAVEGNHELYGDNGKLAFFENTNIQFLKDTVLKIDRAFYLVGRKDRHNRDRKPLNDLLEYTTDSLPSIVMDHQPYQLEKSSSRDIDIMVSGHTHHGQLFPFQWITEAIYRISWGHEKINNTNFFVTCGAQGWGPPVKTSSQSEIMVIKVNLVEEKYD